MNWNATGAIGLALGVILGDFWAPALEPAWIGNSMGVHELAVFSLHPCAAGLLDVSILKTRCRVAGRWFMGVRSAGVVLSRSLYRLAVMRNWRGSELSLQLVASSIAAWVLLATTLLEQAQPE